MERDRAVEYLREHMSVGRLTQDEFDERLSAALQARTNADLDPLFSDLPAPKPGQPAPAAGGSPWPVYQPQANQPVPIASAAQPPSLNPSVTKALNIAAAVVWPAWILFCFAVSWNFWWLVYIPIAISILAGKRKEEQKREEKLWLRQQERGQLPRRDDDPGS